MITTQIDLPVVRGDTLQRFIPLGTINPDGTRVAMSAADANDLKTRFTQLYFQARLTADTNTALVTADHTNGALQIVASPRAGIMLEVPATDMNNIADGVYDIQIVEPRAGNPLGPRVWTILAGKIAVTKDVYRAP